MSNKITIAILSILTIFFLTAQTCSFGTTSSGLAADCIGEGDIVCDDTEAYECGLAAYGTGYYVSRSSENDAEYCGAVDTTDTDEDGVYDADDLCEGYDDTEDNDGDGTPDGCDTDDDDDDDDDGMADIWERHYGLDFTTDDGGDDADGDGLTNLEEFEADTDPTEADTDGDGVSDGDEMDTGTDPLDDGSYSSEATCSDEGDDPYTKQAATGSDGVIYYDDCESDVYVIERVCASDESVTYTSTNCYDLGMVCSDGACVEEAALAVDCGGPYTVDSQGTVTLDASASTGTVSRYCIEFAPGASWINSYGPSYEADYETTTCTDITDVSEISFDHTFTYSGDYSMGLVLYGETSSEYDYCTESVAVTCSLDDDCYYDSYCESGVCVECNADSDCDVGYVCNADYSCELDGAADADGDGVITDIEELLGFDPEDDNDLDSYGILMMNVDDNSHANIIGSGYIGTIINSPYDIGIVTGNVALGTDSEVGDYLDFSDTTGDDHIDFSSSGSTDYDFTNWFIITAKVKPSSADLSNKHMIVMRSPSSGCLPEYTLAVESGKYYNRLMKVDETFNYVFGGTPSTSEWQEVTMVYSSSLQKLYLYVDGVYKSSRSATEPITPSGKGLIVGGNPDCASQYNYDGGVDYVKIWGD